MIFGKISKAIQDFVQEQVREEVKVVVSGKCPSLKGRKTLIELSDFDWKNIFDELMTVCPTLTQILAAVLTTKATQNYLGLASAPTTQTVLPFTGA